MFSQVSVCPQGSVCLWSWEGWCLPHTPWADPPAHILLADPPRADPLAPGQTCPGQTPPGRHPLGRHPPGQTPPAPCPVHAGIHTPCPMHAGIHPPSRYHGIRSTSGLYASHWNAFFSKFSFKFFKFKNSTTFETWTRLTKFTVLID